MLSTEGTLRVLNQTKPELNTTLENALTRSSVTAILFTIQNAKQSLIKIRIRKKKLRVVEINSWINAFLGSRNQLYGYFVVISYNKRVRSVFWSQYASVFFYILLPFLVPGSPRLGIITIASREIGENYNSKWPTRRDLIRIEEGILRNIWKK